MSNWLPFHPVPRAHLRPFPSPLIPSNTYTLLEQAFIFTMRRVFTQPGGGGVRCNKVALEVWARAINDPFCFCAPTSDHTEELGSILGITQWPGNIRPYLHELVAAIAAADPRTPVNHLQAELTPDA